MRASPKPNFAILGYFFWLQEVFLALGVLTLFAGLYQAFRVVRFYTRATQLEHGFGYWAIVPFAIADNLELASIVVILLLVGNRLNWIGFVVIAAAVFSYIGVGAVMVLWTRQIVGLTKHFSWRGLVGLFVIIWPNLFTVLLFLVGVLGVRPAS
jgi:hypothetical protein